MNYKPLIIGDLIAKVPIIQGGMGIGVSRSGLAAAVANEGGIGIISGVAIGFTEPNFKKDTLNANIKALKYEIQRAKELAPNGIIGVNFLCAMNNYDDMVRVAIEEGIHLIISGAGIPTTLPELTKGTKTKIAPIVSSGKAAKLILKLWDKRHNQTADLVIVEGPKAGGHLGYLVEQLEENNMPNLLTIFKEVAEEIKPYEEKYNKKIPIVVAGGIFNGFDIAECLNAGADGVQMATRFVGTDECDANIEYKKAYVGSKKEDMLIINSPVGMPGRAIKNAFTENIVSNPEKIVGCYLCLKGCNPKVAPYCISKVLIDSVNGNVSEGLIFAGSNAYRVDKITSVKELINELMAELKSC
jgi:nitronate monooxygenase